LKELTSEKILKGIFENDSTVIQYVYDRYFNTIKSFVHRYGGADEDAWDIFQDGIVVIYEQIKNENLIVKNSFLTYFYTICKYQWLNVIRERDSKYFQSIEDSLEADRLNLNEENLKLDEAIEKEKRIKLYQRNVAKLSKECQALLKLVAKGYNTDEITKELDYKSTGFTYKKRRICKERLIKLINTDTEQLTN
jgi:RNA polymerase sigma factor (sigma-70 family)